MGPESLHEMTWMFKYFNLKSIFIYTVFCLGRDFVTFSSRCTICRIRILNKYAVISPDKQNNDRKVSDCLSLTCRIFVLLTPLKQCINLKWPLNILNHVSHSHLLMSSQIKQLILSIFRKWWSPYCPAKKTHVVWIIEIITAIVTQTSKFFYITITMDISFIYNS